VEVGIREAYRLVLLVLFKSLFYHSSDVVRDDAPIRSLSPNEIPGLHLLFHLSSTHDLSSFTKWILPMPLTGIIRMAIYRLTSISCFVSRVQSPRDRILQWAKGYTLRSSNKVRIEEGKRKRWGFVSMVGISYKVRV
jgi:hypothetical protein